MYDLKFPMFDEGPKPSTVFTLICMIIAGLAGSISLIAFLSIEAFLIVLFGIVLFGIVRGFALGHIKIAKVEKDV